MNTMFNTGSQNVVLHIFFFLFQICFENLIVNQALKRQPSFTFNRLIYRLKMTELIH